MAGPIVTIPLKSVVAWWPISVNETPPLGWAVANGQTLTNPATSDQQLWNQQVNPGAGQAWITPDLRNKQILGADPTIATTTTSGSHTLPQATITVQTNGALTFPTTGVLNINNGQMVTYTGKTTNTFTGCTGGSGVVSASSPVTFAGKNLADGNINSQAGAPGIKGEWGSNKANLTVTGQIPQHTHSQGTQTGTSVTANPSHTHNDWQTNQISHNHGGATGGASHAHAIGFNSWTFENTGILIAWLLGGPPNTWLYSAVTTTSTDGPHAHGFYTDGAHTHTINGGASHSHPGTTHTTGTTATTGTGEAHDNRGMYAALTYLVKVKH